MRKQSFNVNSTNGNQALVETTPSSLDADPQCCPLRRFIWTDALIIVLIAASSALTISAFRNLAPDKVAIFRENRQIATYPLTEDRMVTVEGANGPVEIDIRNRTVSIVRADCPHGICIKTGSIGRPYRQIVCAPNHILVTITSSADDSLDAIVK